ncbi:hypothetical protein EDC04DRAFT_2208779 [Pisolithus marmoratus]|nr:hypothetical protein EDC04DRAFT_2208779 [Pisolithus marmoratus]
MSVPRTLLRMLARCLKSLIVIAKRCSSTTAHFLRYIFSLWNVTIQKLRERKNFTKGNLDNSPPSTTPCNDREMGREVEAAVGVGSATILCSRDRPTDVGNSRGRTPRLRRSNPPLRDPRLLHKLPSTLWMLLSFGHFGFIQRALKTTQRKPAAQRNGLGTTQHGQQSCNYETDVDRWITFCEAFQNDVDNISLLVGYCATDSKLQLLGSRSCQ